MKGNNTSHTEKNANDLKLLEEKLEKLYDALDSPLTIEEFDTLRRKISVLTTKIETEKIRNHNGWKGVNATPAKLNKGGNKPKMKM
jgi:hypothetical protein